MEEKPESETISDAALTSQQLFASSAYLLHEKLGEGGMGEVYRATHRLSGRQVALKRIYISSSSRPSTAKWAASARQATHTRSLELRMSLAQEFQILASLHHPHIVSVLDYGFSDHESPFFTMELLQSPQTILEAGQGKPVRTKIDLLVQLLQALVYLHRRNLLHRDIKPSNVIVTNDHVKLLDFGISGTIGRIERLAGTLEYMAPEVFLGEVPSSGTDLYSVGIVAYQLLTGRFPNSARNTDFLDDLLGPDSDATLHPDAAALLTGRNSAVEFASKPKPPDLQSPTNALLEALDESVRAIAPTIIKLLERSPNDRFHDAAEVIRELGSALGESLPVETVATRESFLQAAEFVGRERELEQIHALLKEAQSGHGNIVLIAGESGVGKSRLIHELRTRALVRSASVVSNQASTENGGNYSLWAPIIRSICLDAIVDDREIGILKDIAPDLESLLGRRGSVPQSITPQEVQARLHATVAELLKRRTTVLVIILEDLQWAGTESLKLLADLNPIVQRLPVLIVGNYREDEASAMLRSLPIGQRMKLERLGAGQIAELAESILGGAGRQPELVAYLQRQTEGNVFFVVEVLRALAEQSGQLDRVGGQELPEQLLTGGMEQLLRGRLRRLGTEDRALLDLSAVAGRHLDLAVLQRASCQQDLTAWLVRCANAAVLEMKQGDWLFEHDKIRESLINHLEPTKRRDLHRQVAEAIIDIYGQDPSHDAMLGYHFSRAGLPQRAFGFFIKAGQATSRLYAVKQAQSYYASALEALLQLPDTPENRRRRIETMLLQGGVYLWDEKTEQVPALMFEAEALALSQPTEATTRRADQALLAKVYFTMGRGYFATNRQSQAISCYQKARDVARESEDEKQRTFYSGMIGHAMVLQGHMGTCMPYLDEAVKWLEPQGRTAEWMRMASFRGLAMVARGQVREGLQKIHATLGDADDPLTVAIWNSYLATAHLFAQDWVAMRHAAAQAAVLCRQINNKFLEYSVLWFQGWAESWLGDLAGSAKHREEAAALFRRIGSSRLHDLLAVAESDAALHQGQFERAIEVAQEAISSARISGAIFGEGLAHRSWARALALQPSPNWEDAEFHIAESVRLFEQGEAWVSMAHSLIGWGALDFAQGKMDAAAEHCQKAAEMFGSYELYYAQAHARQLATSARLNHDGGRTLIIHSGLVGGLASW